MRQQVKNGSGARMSIEINCEQCQKRYRVKAELAGKRVRCMHCGNPVNVPGVEGQPGERGPDLGVPPQPHRENPGVPRNPGPGRAAPPPVPKQVVRFDPRFDPQALTDFPTPPAPQAPQIPQAAPRKNPQPANKKVENQPA